MTKNRFYNLCWVFVIFIFMLMPLRVLAEGEAASKATETVPEKKTEVSTEKTEEKVDAKDILEEDSSPDDKVERTISQEDEDLLLEKKTKAPSKVVESLGEDLDKREFSGDTPLEMAREVPTSIISNVSSHIDLVSPTQEQFLTQVFPVADGELPPMYGEYNFTELKIPLKNDWNQIDKKSHLRKLEKILTENIDGNPNGALANDQLAYFKADLLLYLGMNGSEGKTKEAYKAYQQAMNAFPDSKLIHHAHYNIVLILLKYGQYSDASLIGQKMASRYAKNEQWGPLYRNLNIESYYLRGRYIRAEDYVWQLAHEINKEEFNSFIARRFGDSLFWQNKYKEVVEWYENPAMADILKGKGLSVTISKLYFAESLFQTKDIEKAMALYKEIDSAYKENDTLKRILQYRILQGKLLNNGNIKEITEQFYSFFLKEEIKDLKTAALLQWARLIAKQDDKNLYASAHSQIESVYQSKTKRSIRGEILLVRSYLEWRLGDTRSAYETIRKLIPHYYIPNLGTPLNIAASDMAVLLLLEEAPSYWANNDYVGFLVQCNRLKEGIQISTKKTEILRWIGRAYVESGLVVAGVRLFQRMILDLPEEEKTRLSLELARAYGLMNEKELMGKALSMIKEVPTNTKERELYYLTKATYNLSMKNYDECINQFDNILKSGVRGSELFSFALQGAICARKAKRYDKALNFLNMLGAQDLKVLPPAEVEKLKNWQKRAYYERINLYINQGQAEYALPIFEVMEESLKDYIPLETVLLVVDAYRQLHEPDKAIHFWKKYAEKKDELPDNFKESYTQLLETLSRVELLPIN